jgi:hypothetical protein
MYARTGVLDQLRTNPQDIATAGVGHRATTDGHHWTYAANTLELRDVTGDRRRGRGEAQMTEPHTLLEALVRQRQLSWDEAARAVCEAAREHGERTLSLSSRHLARLARHEREGEATPNPATCRALQYAFGRPIEELLTPLVQGQLVVVGSKSIEPIQKTSEVLTMAADRARHFMARLQTMSDESIALVQEDVRDLVRSYPTLPLNLVLGHMVSLQETVFTLLERPQRPSHARQLYFMSAIVGGLLAKASHDLADPHAALAQSRTAWLCAEQADHDGARAWICGLQALISYWARRPHDSVRYAQRGAEFAARAGNSSIVWLAASEARAWGLLGHADQTRAAIERAEDAWTLVRPDEMDEMGGVATFSRARQLYFAADALAWLPEQAGAAERYSRQAIDAYHDPADPDWAFGDAAGSRTDLAVARINRGEIDGATEIIAPVLDLPPEQRINGIVHSVNRVHQALDGTSSATGAELQQAIEHYTRTPVRSLTR